MAHLTATNKNGAAWIGQRVYVKKKILGTLRYVGEIKFKRGIWCGIELDEAVGETNGMINTVQYFKCEAGYGTFSPVCEITVIRKPNTEASSVCELLKLKCLECKKNTTLINKLNSRQKIKQSSRLSDSDKLQLRDENNKRETQLLDKTLNLNKKKDTNAAFTSQAQKENLKRTRKSYDRLKTEESLGIISDLLVDDESWEFSDPIADNVFYPSMKTPKSRSSFYNGHVDSPIENCLNANCTSTPKNYLNVMDLNKTVKLNDKPYIPCDEVEPIIADSSCLKFKTDFDVENFKENDILCSTSKFSLLPFSGQYPVLDEMSLVKNGKSAESGTNAEYKDAIIPNKVKSPTISTNSDVCTNSIEQCDIYTENIAQNSNPLNLTYEIISNEFQSPTLKNPMILKDSNMYSKSEYHQKSNEVINMNSTFVMPNFQQVSEGEKTFIIDQSPINIGKTLSLESNAISKKKLSTVFESSTENELSKTTCENNSIKSEGTFEVLIEPVKSLLPKIDEENIVDLELNSTFCVGNESNHKKSIANQGSKRCSLPAAFMKKGLCIPEDNMAIHSMKIKMQKSATEVQLPVTAKKKCLKSSISYPIGASTSKQSKNVQAKYSNLPKVGLTTKKSSEMAPKHSVKKTCSTLESGLNVAGKMNQHKDLMFAQSIGSIGKQGIDSINLPFSNKENNKNITCRKSVSNCTTKVIPKPSFKYNKMDNSESNLKHKVTGGSSSYGLKLDSPSCAKLSTIKHRHSMLPTLHAKTPSSKEIFKTRNVSCNKNAAKSSFIFTNGKNVQTTQNKQQESGSEKKERKSMIEPSVKNSENKLSMNSDKKMDNFKSKLLKPGALSRLPAPRKSIKVGPNLGTIESQKQLSMKVNVIGDQRIGRKLSVQKQN